LLARRYIGWTAAGWAAVGVLSLPYLWLMGSRPMSECAGIAVLWWLVWSVRAAAEQPGSHVRSGVVVGLFGLLMGIRLSYFPFGIAVALLLLFQYRQAAGGKGRGRRLVLSVAAMAGAQLVWIGGMALSEGSLAGFWKLSKAFIAGHFTEWGGGVAASGMPLGQRIVTLAYDHFIVDVWSGRSIGIGILSVLMLAVALTGIVRAKNKPERKEQTNADTAADKANTIHWLWICLAAYTLWVLFGQNIEKPRHIAPVAGPLALVLYIAVIRALQSIWRDCPWTRGCRKCVVAAAACLLPAVTIAVQLSVGIQLIRQQAEQKPAVYQLHEFLEERDEPIVLYTWEETRVLGYLRAGYEHRKIWTFAYFQALAQAEPARRILLTNHVLDGFLRQNPDAGSMVVPVAEFRSESLFEPVYSRIMVYEWKESPG
jgi:hypothetical protein